MLPVYPAHDMKRAIRDAGPLVPFYRAGNVTPVNVHARIKWLTAVELANAIEAYPIIVTVDSDEITPPPSKGDEFVIDGARRGVMDVKKIHWGATLVAYQLGVQG